MAHHMAHPAYDKIQQPLKLVAQWKRHSFVHYNDIPVQTACSDIQKLGMCAQQFAQGRSDLVSELERIRTVYLLKQRWSTGVAKVTLLNIQHWIW